MTKSIMKINEHGDKKWYLDGKIHRENDLPAIEDINGDKQWWIHGERHRENNLSAVEHADGKRKWFLNGVESPWLEEILKTKAHLDEKLNLNIDIHKSKRKI